MRSVVPLALVLAACTVETIDPGDGALPDAGMDAAVAECSRDVDCSDGIECTIDHCEGGVCVPSPCTGCCPDGLECAVALGCTDAVVRCTADAECEDDVRCTLDTCRDGERCDHVPQDGLCPGGEVCLPALGCIPRPPEACETGADCSRGNECLGEWSCQPEFGCQFRRPPTCDDDDACTVDGCDLDLRMCTFDLRDGDEDGFGDAECGGDDCDDADADTNPDATEVCDGDDDDCDEVVDEGCCAEGETCTTSCGSTGAISCVDGRCVGVEACGGGDEDCDGLTDEGFGCSPGEAEPCDTTCGSTGTRECLADCRWDACVPPAEICNGVDDNCNLACDETFTCCRGETTSCTTLGFLAGSATCEGDCTGWDTSGCSACGDGAVDGGEDCDGSALDGNDCTTVPGDFGSGTLRCTSACAFDTSGCSLCGNGDLDPGEQCDGARLGGARCETVPGGGFTGGTLRCTSACTYDTSGCTTWTPAGVYDVAPTASYMCAMSGGSYLVDYDIASFTFADDGTTLTVSSGGGRCDMTGPSARSSRTISVTCTESGLCDEVYRLEGTFGTDDQFTGTYTVRFIPLLPGACADCANQTHAVTGDRR